MPVWLQPDAAYPPHASWRSRLVAVLTGTALVATLTSGVAGAQDGTSGAPPLEETGCVLVPASEMDAILAEGGAVASPVASPVADQATPVAATPVAADDSLLLEDLTAAATSLTSCLTEGRFADVAQRTSPLFRGQLLGVAEPVTAEVFGSLAATLPEVSYTIVEIGSPAVVDPAGTATAQIVWQVGQQVRVDQWTFVRSEVQGVPMWTVDRAAPGTIDPEIEAQTVEVTIADNAYALATESIEGEAVVFDVTNTDGVAQELLVLKLDEGVETSQLLTTPGPSLPEGFTFVGQATIPADGSGRLLLANLEPGRYAVVNLLPDENGLPRLAQGMEATFTVEE